MTISSIMHCGSVKFNTRERFIGTPGLPAPPVRKPHESVQLARGDTHLISLWEHERFIRLSLQGTTRPFWIVFGSRALYCTLPTTLLFGLVGNALTITVLLSHDMMSRANIFLTCLAVCDICFLILIIPHSLANFEVIALHMAFRQFYLPFKMHLIALANWASAVAIWLVVGVSFERVVGVRWPLHRLSKPSSRRLATGLILLVFSCALLTFYNHLSHQCISKTFCNGTQLLSTCLAVDVDVWHGNRTNLSPIFLRSYVRYMRAAHAIFVLIVPLILLISLNVMLFYYVKKRSFFLYASLGKVTQRMRRPGEAALPLVGTLFRRHSDQRQVKMVHQRRERFSKERILQQKTEHRVAVTVCAVVTSFTITQAPSAVVLCVKTLYPNIINSSWKSQWYTVAAVTSFLVVVGKSVNFIVFCLSSSSFRQRLLSYIKSRYGIKDEKRCLSVTQYSRCDSRDSRVLSAKKSFQSI